MCATAAPILLVEDNPVDLDLTQRALSGRKLANPIEIARDGEEALGFVPGRVVRGSFDGPIALEGHFHVRSSGGVGLVEISFSRNGSGISRRSRCSGGAS